MPVKILDKRELLKSTVQDLSEELSSSPESWDVDDGMPPRTIIQSADVSKIKWTNRRRHAWIALIATEIMIPILLALILFGIINFKDVVPLFQTIMGVNMGIIFAYMGFTGIPLMFAGRGRK